MSLDILFSLYIRDLQLAATVGLLAIDGPTHVRQNVGGRSIYSVDLSGSHGWRRVIQRQSRPQG
jgi:hypothetical protein